MTAGHAFRVRSDAGSNLELGAVATRQALRPEAWIGMYSYRFANRPDTLDRAGEVRAEDIGAIARIVLFAVFSLAFSVSGLAQNAPLIGIDSNYALDMATRQRAWKDRSGPVDPCAMFAKLGCQNARIRLWVGENGINRLTYATETARCAQQAGLKPYLVIFLSDDWADFVKQPAPAEWKNLAAKLKLGAIEAYSERIVRHMAAKGVAIDTFEIGNEIDFGICGEFEEEWPRRVSLDFMRTKVWPRMVPILKAAEAGVLKAQPKARFILHLSQWNNVNYCIAFWQAMARPASSLTILGSATFPLPPRSRHSDPSIICVRRSRRSSRHCTSRC